jgi:hypothetical protein
MALEFKRERAAGEITMETRPVDLPDCGEEEYDWIVRSTPAASDVFPLVDDWSTPDAMPPQRDNFADPGAYQSEELTEPTASTTAERFLAEWSGPELVQPATEIFDTPPNEDKEIEMSTAPAVGEEVDLAEWSGPELVQPAIEIFDTQPNEDDELEASSASVGEVDLSEWSGPELAPPIIESNEELEMSTAPAPGTVPGAVATGSKTQNEVDVVPWTKPELATPSTEFFDNQATEDDELEVSTASAPATVLGAVATGAKTQNEVDLAERSEPESAVSVESESSVVPLKYPPPIWDQVPVYPAAEFHATGAFLTRLSAINWTLVLATVMVMSICGVCAFAILKLVQLDQNKAPAAAQQLAKQPEPRVEAPARSTDEKPAEPVTPASETAGSNPSAASTSSTGQPESKSAADTTQPVTASENKLAKLGSHAEASKNSTKGNVITKAPSRTVLANRRNTAPPNPRQIARNISTSHSSVSTPASSPTSVRNSPSSSGRSPSSGASSPSSRGSSPSGRRTEPTTNNGSQSAPTVNPGNGSTRPRRVTPPPGP